jgi:hypothetical protein
MRSYEPPAAATAQRPSWGELPADVRSFVEGRFGTVTHARSQGGGYTPGFASRLGTIDGRAFVKAIDRGNALVHASYRREAEVNAAG